MSVRYEDNSAAFLARVQTAADAGVGRAASGVQKSIQDSLQRFRGAVEGTGGDTGIRTRYRGSPVGSPPGYRTGRLIRSISMQRRAPMRWAVGTNLEYGRIHELGGVINRKPQPYIVISQKGGGARAVFVSDTKAQQLQSEGKTVKNTRSYTINMPRRPYLAPGLSSAQASGRLQRDFNAGFKSKWGAA